jgi:O-antigen/teichoic acid export membrane protein
MILSIMLQLVSVPVCLHFWGAQGYGAWLAIFAASTLLRTVDGGYVTYAGNRLNLLYHQDRQALRRVLAAGSLGLAVLGLLQLSLLGFVIAFDGLGWLLGDAALAGNSNARAALVVLVVSWLLSGSYLGLVHRLMVPAGLLYQSAWWSMAFQAIVFVAIMFAAALRLDLLGTSLLVAGVQAGIYIASADYLRRKLPEFFPWWRAPAWRLAAADLRGSLTFAFSGFMQQAATNGMVLVVSAVLGAAVVPAFTTVRTLANLWTNVTTTLTSPLLPDMVRLHANHQPAKLLMLSKAHTWLLGTLVNLGILVSLPLLSWVYGLWTHGELVLDARLLAGLLAGILLANAGSFMSTYLAGINHERAVLVLALLRGFVSLIVTWLLLPKFGLAAAGVGIMAAEALCFLAIAGRYFPQSVRPAGSRAWSSATTGWSLVGLVATLALIGTSAALERVPTVPFLLSIALVLLSSWQGWKSIDEAVQQRLLGLFARVVPFGRTR